MDPSDIPLPALLDPLLDRLADALPPQVYTILLSFLSHGLALLTASINIIRALFSISPSRWDAQTLIPPLITVLAAYLALVSLYRTTSWMFKMSVWMLKWGSVVGILAAGAGWISGQGRDGQGGGGNMNLGGLGGGLVSNIMRIVLDMINGQGQNAGGGTRRTQRPRRGRAAASAGRERPAAWESFERHREWQYQEEQANAREGQNSAERLFEEVVGAVREGGWWDAAKSFIDGQVHGNAQDDADGTAGRITQPARKAKTKARRANQKVD